MSNAQTMTNEDGTSFRIPRELVALQNRAKNEFKVSLTALAEEAGIEDGSRLSINLDLDEEPPMVVIGPAPDDEEMAVGDVRTLSQKLPLPKDVLEDLGLDLDTYDGENPFLFGPIALEEMIILEPLGYASEVLDEDAEDEDVDEQDALSVLSADDIVATSNATGVPERGLRNALEDVTPSVADEDLSELQSDDYNPVEGEDATVVFVEREEWTTRVADQLGCDREDDLVEAVRLAHNRAGRHLVSGDREYRRFEDVADAVVVRR